MKSPEFWLIAGMVLSAPHVSSWVGSIFGATYTMVGLYFLFKEK
jgi:hypothetical protein